MLQRETIVGVLLAGGRSQRMGGGDKCLQKLGESTLLARAQERASAQVGDLILSANGDHSRFREAGLPVVADLAPDHAGPLAGLLSAMEWTAAMRPAASHVATFTTDTPFFPRNLVSRLCEGALQRDCAIAVSGGRSHPAFGLWPVALRETLRAFLDGGERRVIQWATAQKARPVSFDTGPEDFFFNINTPDDLAVARAMATGLSD
jgi:molybdenum cofactor guanylyltransferase